MFGDVQTAAKLMVKVGADVQEAQHKLNGMSKEFDALKAAGTKMAMGVTVAVAAVGAATVAFAAKAIAAGSDLAETQNKIDAVFGQSASAMEQWASTANKTMGLSKQAALDYSGSLGNMFSQLGAGQEKAAEMSRGLVGLSADLASFHNVTGGASEVLEAMSASFRGEYDAMQRYIPTLNAAAVEHQALAMTGKATADSLTAMDKALATQAIMLRDAGAAAGDFANTSTGWANQNRILQTTLANMTAEIGTKLLPVVNSFLQQLVDFVQTSGPAIVTTIGTIVTSFQSMITVLGQVDLSVVTAQFTALQQSIGVDFWAQVFGFISQQIALTVTNFQELGFELSSIGAQFAAFGEFLKGDTSWSEYRARMQELQVEYDAARAAFQTTYDDINGRDWGGAISALNAVSEANAQATDWWQRHSEALRTVNEDTSAASDALVSLADIWTQAYQAIQDTTVASMDNSRLKVLQTFNAMAQDYANHATTIVDLENRKGQMVAYLESVYQQQAAALVAAGQTAQLGVLAQAHNAKLKSVLASYNTQISLERSGQTALLSNAKKYYLTTLQMMAKALIAQVATVRANMTALVHMIVSGYGSAAAAARAFYLIQEGMTDIGAINAAMAEVTAAFDAIEGAGIGAITEASQAFQDWQADIGDVATGLADVASGLNDVSNAGSGVQASAIDPLQAAARVVESLASMVQRAIEAFDQLAEWGGPQAGWVQKFDSLLSAVRYVVVKFAALAAALKKDAVDKAAEFSKAAATIVGLIGAGVSAFKALADSDTTVSGIRDKVDAIVSFVRYVVVKMAQVAADLKSDAVAKAASFADSATKIIAPLKAMVEAFAAVQAWVAEDMTGIFGGLLSQLMTLARLWVVAANAFSKEVLAAALWFADTATRVVSPLKAMVDGFAAVQDWVARDMTGLFAGILSQLMTLARLWVVAGGAFSEDILEGALWFADIASKIVAPLKAMADGFAEVQSWLAQDMTGIFAGILSQLMTLARLWVVAAGAFNEDVLAGALWFAGIASKIVAPLKAMADGFAAVQAWVAQDMTGMFAGILSQLMTLARLWSVAASAFNEEMLRGALWFADIASKIVAPLKAMADGFAAVQDWVAQDMTAMIGGILHQLMTLARLWSVAASAFNEEMLRGALWFAGIAAVIVGPIKAMVEAFTALQNFDPTGGGSGFGTNNSPMSALMRQLRALIQEWVDMAALFDTQGVKAAKAFAEAVEPMIDTLSAALDLLTKIKTYVEPSANALLAFQRDVEDMLLRFTRWVVFVIQPIAKDIDKETMQAMQEMIDGLQGALELLNGLVDYVAPSAASLTAFMDGVQQLAEDFIDWATTNGPQLFREIPPEFLAAFRDVFEGLSAAVDVLTGLVDFVAPSVMAVMSFEEGYQRLFLDWVTWVQNNFSQTTNDLLVAIAEVFSQVMSGLATAVDVLAALVGFVAPSVMAVMSFEEGYQRLFLDWVTWATGTFADLNTELVAAVASVFGDVFDGIGAAVATLTALSGYVSPSATAILAFETDYQRLFTGFVTWVETTFTDISSDLVVAMTGAASALFQGLGAAATTLTQITGYVGPTETTITRFEQDYQRLATGFRTWAESSWTEETAATTTAVGNAINALYQGLGTAATTLSLIRNYTPASQAVIDRFIADMTAVMGTMLTWVQTSFGVDAQAIMTSFGNTTQALFSGLGTALNVLQGIAAYTVPDSQFVLALQRFNANLLTAITSWQIWLTNTFTPETAALVQQFHTILSGIVTDMGAALQLLMDIDQANLPTADELLAFLEAVVALFDGVIAMFGGVTGEITQLVGAMADAFQEIFDAIEIAVSDFGSVLYAGLGQLFATLAGQMWAWGDYAAGMFMSGLLAGMQNINSVNAVVAAMRDLAEQLEAELRLAWGLHSPSRVAMGMGQMFVEGLALGLRDLAGIPSLIQNELALGGVALGADIRFSPAPRHDRLTIEFQGAYQAGMSPAEEKRITQAMVGELRRQGVALQVARV